MGAQCVTVVVYTIKHNGRNREHHSWGREFSLGEDVMNQAAMQPSVAVQEWVDIDETKSGRCCLQDGVELRLAHEFVRLDQTLHQRRQIFRTCANKFWQGIAAMITLSEEHTIRPESRVYETSVPDQHAV